MKKVIGTFVSAHGVVDFGRTCVLGQAHIDKVQNTVVSFSLDGEKYFPSKVYIKDNDFDFGGLTARYIRLSFDYVLTVSAGEGYTASPAPQWDALFLTHQPWGGGDGIYSYLISKKDNRRMIVFGDTFYGTLGADLTRLAPLAMPHNSIVYLTGKEPEAEKLEFNVKRGEKNRVASYFVPDNDLSRAGSGAGNLVIYHNPLFHDGWLSAYEDSGNISLTFHFPQKEDLDWVEIENYHLDGDKTHAYEKRGVRRLSLLVADKTIKTILDPYSEEKKTQTVRLSGTAEEVIFVIPAEIGTGNWGGTNGHEALFGLRQVRFHSRTDGYLEDVSASASSEFISDDKHAWFWLQDGLMTDEAYYSLPFVGIPDASQPEGFQFRIEGISLVKVPLKDGRLDTEHISQKATSLYATDNGATLSFGCAVLDNSSRDGFVYIYGNHYKPFDSDKGRRLIVARVKKEDFSDLNKWTYFDGQKFQRDILLCAPLLDHVSTECSITFDGKGYVTVFTIDTQGKEIAYALSPSPYGPFGEARIVYTCPEKVCPHLYQYNAKAHPVLSETGKLLVSYNVNTSDFGENMQYGNCYGPRFLVLEKAGE
jgi:hypothetical protein